MSYSPNMFTGGGGGSGTVTSVSGAGTVSGLTLTGTVTTSGSLTLGGTLTATSANISDFTEASQDVVGAMIAAAGGSYNDAAGTITLPGGGGSLALTTVEVNLGSSARRAGKFTLSGLSGLTIGKPVMMQQAVGPYTGKGTRADEAEMDQVSVSASVTATDTITAYWHATGRVRGNRKFNYAVGA